MLFFGLFINIYLLLLLLNEFHQIICWSINSYDNLESKEKDIEDFKTLMTPTLRMITFLQKKT